MPYDTAMKRLLIIFISLFAAQIGFCQTKNTQYSIDLETNLIAMSAISLHLQTPMGDRSFMIFSGGAIIGTGFGYGSNGIKVEAGLLSFGPKHFLETSTLYLSGFDEGGSIGGKLGYRYQTNKRLILLASVYFLTNVDPPVIPSLGIGFKL